MGRQLPNGRISSGQAVSQGRTQSSPTIKVQSQPDLVVVAARLKPKVKSYLLLARSDPDSCHGILNHEHCRIPCKNSLDGHARPGVAGWRLPVAGLLVFGMILHFWNGFNSILSGTQHGTWNFGNRRSFLKGTLKSVIIPAFIDTVDLLCVRNDPSEQMKPTHSSAKKANSAYSFL